MENKTKFTDVNGKEINGAYLENLLNNPELCKQFIEENEETVKEIINAVLSVVEKIN